MKNLIILISIGFLFSGCDKENEPSPPPKVTVGSQAADPYQYLVIHPFEGWDEGKYAADMLNVLGHGAGNRKLAFGTQSLTFDDSETVALQKLDTAFAQAEALDMPVWIHLDNEWFATQRPDLWNWFDPTQPGYNPDNKNNVEWTDWDTPSKFFYLNWGDVLKLPPRLCFDSPIVRGEVLKRSQAVANKVNIWRQKLAGMNKDYLFLGIDPGWETGIPNMTKSTSVPVDGRLNYGFCVLHNRGFSKSNPPLDAESVLIGAVKDYAEFEAKAFADAGIPVDKIYTHIPGFEGHPNAPLSQRSPLSTAFNNYSRPGFSLYPNIYFKDQVLNSVVGKTWAVSEAPPTNDVAILMNETNLKIAVLYSWSANIKNDPVALQIVKDILKGQTLPADAGKTIGTIDGIFSSSSGPVIAGWACGTKVPYSIKIHMYLGGPAGIGQMFGEYNANQASEPAVATACSSTGSNYRFAIPMDPLFLNAYGGKKIYIYGISPTGKQNELIVGSGNFQVPTGSPSSTTTTLAPPPVTVPPTTTIAPTTTVQTQLIDVHRFYKGTDHWLTADYNAGKAAGYAYEGVAFKAFVQSASGRIAIYSCLLAGRDYFVSVDSNCEGQKIDALIGFIESNSTAGNIPVYRFWSSVLFDHLVTTNKQEGVNAGYSYEGILGYVP